MKDYSTEDIVRYLDGRMPENEKKAFEQTASENAALRDQVESYQSLIAGIQDKVMQDVREEVGSYEKGSSFRWLRYAAAISILAVLGLYLIFIQEPVYDKYFTPYPNIATLRSSPGEMDAALQAYSEGKYTEAARSLEVLGNKSDTADFYLASARLFSGESETAEADFKRLLTQTETFREQVQWYLVKSLLDQGKKQEAREQLQVILSDPGHSFYLRAVTLDEGVL